MSSPQPAEPTVLPISSALPLCTQPAGAHMRIVRVDADCQDATRLKALGVCIGRRLLVLKAGDPMIIRVVGARVGLSARLAAAVWVESPQAGSKRDARPVRAAV